MPDSSGSQSAAFSTLLGNGEFDQHCSRHFMLGFLVQSMGLAALVAIATYIGRNPRPGRGLGAAIANIAPISFQLSSDKLAPSRGALPKMTLDDQLTPPEEGRGANQSVGRGKDEIATQATQVPTFTKNVKVGQPPNGNQIVGSSGREALLAL